MRTQENARLLTRIRQLHAEADGIIGSPRLWEDLRYAGERCRRHRVGHLMRWAACVVCRSGDAGAPSRQGHLPLEPTTIWSETLRPQLPTPNG